jgi:predicted PurR-regulated permease PerM
VIGSFSVSNATRWGLNLLGLLGAIIALHLGESIIIPTIIALLLAAMLWPSVRWMHERLFFTWNFSCALAVGGLVILNIFVTLCLVIAVPKVLQDMPDMRDPDSQQRVYGLFRERLGTFMTLDETYFPPKAENSRVFQYVNETLQGPYIARGMLAGLSYGNAWLWQWALIMFLLLFMLVESPMLSRRFVEVFGPSTEAQDKAIAALSDIAHHVRGYLVWRTIINFALALMVGLVYQYGFHLRQAWVWAMLTAVLFYVPYLGPLAAGVGPVMEAFITESPLTALAVIGVYAVIVTIEGYLIVPVVMGHTMELNATTVMLSCLFWDLVWGLPGLFLAMPVMGAVKAICTNVPAWRAWANLMSTSKHEIALDASTDESGCPPVDETQVLSIEEIKKLDGQRPRAVD